MFEPTHWSLVLKARGKSPEAHAALNTLCRTYWFPLYAYVRQKGFPSQEAEDLTQEFFAALLEKRSMESVDPGKGKFRSFLLSSLNHFLCNEWERRRTQKRGGGSVHFSLEALHPEDRFICENQTAPTAELEFDRRWALALLEKSLQLLREEYRQEGKQFQFETLQPYLTETSGNYASSASRLGTTEGAVRVAVHRLRRRMGEILRSEIAVTLDDQSSIDEEIRYLFESLNFS